MITTQARVTWLSHAQAFTTITHPRKRPPSSAIRMKQMQKKASTRNCRMIRQCVSNQRKIEISFTSVHCTQKVPECDFTTAPFTDPRVTEVSHCINEVFVQLRQIRTLQTNLTLPCTFFYFKRIIYEKIFIMEKDLKTMFSLEILICFVSFLKTIT